MYESFENLINERLDDLDGLIESAIQQTADSAGTIAQTIQEQADEFIYDLDNTSFGVNFDARISDAVTAVNAVENAINTMISAANVNAQNELAQLQALAQTIVTQAQVQAQQAAQVNVNTNNNGGGSGSEGSSSITNSGGAISSGQMGGTDKEKANIAKIQQLEEQISKETDKKKNAQSEYNRWLTARNNTMNVLNNLPNSAPQSAKDGLNAQIKDAESKMSIYQDRINSIEALISMYETQINKLKAVSYAKGGTIGSAIKGTGEDGIILARTGEEVLSLERIKQIQGIFKMMQPLAALGTNKTISNIGGTTTVNGMNVSFELPNVTSYEDFVRQAKNDPSFEKLVQNMTIGTALGKSKLSKYS